MYKTKLFTGVSRPFDRWNLEFLKDFTNIDFIKKEVDDSKNLFKKNNWPIIDVTRKSVEETAASILKIIEIKKSK